MEEFWGLRSRSIAGLYTFQTCSLNPHGKGASGNRSATSGLHSRCRFCAITTSSAFWLHRTKARAFTEKQIELVETFANQAVIAIQNARLFSELSETLEQQRVTGEILHAISNSPKDLQSVLSAIAESAARLLDVAGAEIMIVEDQMLRLVTKHGSSLQWPIGSQRQINRNWVTGRAVVDRTTIHVPDLQAAESQFPEGATYAKAYGHRTTLATPLLREGVPIGAILIRRMDVRPFSDKQINLLRTFADQAVIAIENTRLFEEVQARTRELTEALDQQTATSSVLQVISSSPGELSPVFKIILENATSICDAVRRPKSVRWRGVSHGRTAECSARVRGALLERDNASPPGKRPWSSLEN